jgi:hypothetical protein
MVKELPGLQAGRGISRRGFGVVATSVLSGGIVAGQDTVSKKKISAAEARGDFDVMRQALEEAHTGLYRYSSKSEMDRTFARDRARLNGEYSKAELMGALSRTVAAIRCGHTGIQPDDGLRAQVREAKLFPLQVHVEDGKLYALTNELEKDASVRPGMEILEIQGEKAGRVLERMYATLSRDGDIATNKGVQTQRNFAIFYWLLVGQPVAFALKVREQGGPVRSVQLPGLRPGDRKGSQNPVNANWLASNAKLNWSRENLAVRFFDADRVAQIRIGGFGGKDYPEWMDQTFRSLLEKGTKSLIVDLRGNGGGEDLYGAKLVSHLSSKPFRYFDRIAMKTIEPSPFLSAHSMWKSGSSELREGTVAKVGGGYLLKERLHPGLAEQAPATSVFEGKVFFLIDGGTFSTSADVCAVLHHLQRATFVGEETGGGYQGNNSGMQTMVTLPKSGLRLRLPMYEYWNAVTATVNARRGTRPEYPVRNRIGELLTGEDAQLNLALRLAGVPGRALV